MSGRLPHADDQPGHGWFLGQPPRTWQLVRRTPSSVSETAATAGHDAPPTEVSMIGVLSAWPPQLPVPKPERCPATDTSGHFRCGRPAFRPGSGHLQTLCRIRCPPGGCGDYRNRSPGRRPLVGCSQRRWTRPSRAVRRPRSWPSRVCADGWRALDYGYRTGTVSVRTTVVPDPVVARIRTMTSSPSRSSGVSVTAGSASPTATVCQVAPASSLTWTM
jgi:hypothetical protein